MEKMSLISTILLSSLIIEIAFLFKNKSLSPVIKIVISLSLFIINFIIFFLIKKCIKDNKIKKEKDLKEKIKEEKERKKKEEYERILQERKNHIEVLKKEGLDKINIKEKLYVTNMATSINNYQGDKIMITFYGGKLIIYSIDIIRYTFNELLYIKEFDYNSYNAFEMKENKNRIYIYVDIQVLK